MTVRDPKTRTVPARHVRAGHAIVAGVCASIAAASSVAGQSTTMPSTLRYGSGLIDIPVSSVLPHTMVTGTLSGFLVGLGRRAIIDETGVTTDFGPGIDEFYTDASLAVGLFDRAEAGLTFQAFGDDASGGDIWGLFGRVKLWEPIDQGLGLAVGGRYLTSPSFGDGRDYAPGRLGFADDRLLDDYVGGGSADTNLSLYAVGTAFIRGFDGGPLPPNDLTITAGVGSGMFGSPGELGFYSAGHSNGWFAGAAVHVEVTRRSMLTFMAEHNGFDVNAGAQLDIEGYRVGLLYLASNHDWPDDGQSSEYEKPKFGIVGSIGFCPGQRFLRCRPRRMERLEPDTIWIPPPPPDTVIVTVGAQPSTEGEESPLCLSTGQSIPMRLTAEGDTLIGPSWIALRDTRPNLQLAGVYAGETFWYQADQPVYFEGAQYRKTPDAFPLDCTQINRVGFYEGVPVFAVISARRPLDVVFIPVRPGLWQRYQAFGLDR